MKSTSPQLVVLLSLLLASACAKHGDEVVAQVATRSVGADEVRHFLDSFDPGTRTKIGGDATLLDQSLRQYPEQTALVDEARRQGWDQRPEIKAAIAAAERDILVRGFLGSVSEPPADYPSEAEMQAVYDNNTGSFVMPKRFRLAQIFIATAPGADAAKIAAARDQATALTQRARTKDADFAALARSYSQNATSAANGGDSGLVPEAQLLPEIRQILPTLSLNEVSNPVRSPAGWHVVKLLEVRPAEVQAFEDAKPQIRALMRQQRQQALAGDWLAEFRKKQPITINEIALKQVLVPAGGGGTKQP